MKVIDYFEFYEFVFDEWQKTKSASLESEIWYEVIKELERTRIRYYYEDEKKATIYISLNRLVEIMQLIRFDYECFLKYHKCDAGIRKMYMSKLNKVFKKIKKFYRENVEEIPLEKLKVLREEKIKIKKKKKRKGKKKKAKMSDVWVFKVSVDAPIF